MGGSISAGRSNAELVHNLATQHANSRNCPHVEEPMLGVDRGNYFLPAFIHFAYQDQAWKHNQIHLSAPVIYWEVLDLLQLKPGLSFLNLGSGTGYLSTMAGLVLGPTGVNHGIELFQEVIVYAYEKLADFKQNSESMDRYDFCEPVFVQGNCLSLPEDARQYDRVYCGAACPHDKEVYMKSLIKVGGILVMPFDDYLVQIRRVGENQFTTHRSMQVAFSNLQLPSATEGTVATLPELHPPSLKDMSRTRIRQLLREGVEAACPKVTKLRRYVPRPNQGCPYKLEDMSGDNEEEEINSDDDDDLMERENRVIRDDSDDQDDDYNESGARNSYNDDLMSGSELEAASQECHLEENDERIRNVGKDNSVGVKQMKNEGDQSMETVGDSGATNSERGIVKNDGDQSERKDGTQSKKRIESVRAAQDNKVRNSEDTRMENDGDPSVAKDGDQRMGNVGDEYMKCVQDNSEENNVKPCQSKCKSNELAQLGCDDCEETSYQNQEAKCSNQEKDELRNSLEKVLKVIEDKNRTLINSGASNKNFKHSETNCSNSRIETLNSYSENPNDLKGATDDATCSHSENNDLLAKSYDLSCQKNYPPCDQNVFSSQSCNITEITTNKIPSKSGNKYSPCQQNKSNDSSINHDSRKVLRSTNTDSALSSNAFKSENTVPYSDHSNFFKHSANDATSLHDDSSSDNTDRMDTCIDARDISAGPCNVTQVDGKKQTSVEESRRSPISFKREKFDSGVVDDGSSGDSSSVSLDSVVSNDSAISLPPKNSEEKIGDLIKSGRLSEIDRDRPRLGQSSGHDSGGDAKKSVLNTNNDVTSHAESGSFTDDVSDMRKGMSDSKDSLGDVKNRVGDTSKSSSDRKKNVVDAINPFEDAKNRLAGIRKLSALTLNGQTSLKNLFGDGVRTFGASSSSQSEESKQKSEKNEQGEDSKQKSGKNDSCENQSRAHGASTSRSHVDDYLDENKFDDDGDTNEDRSQTSGAFQNSDDELPVELDSEMVDQSPSRHNIPSRATGSRGEERSTSPYPNYRELQDIKQKLRRQDSSKNESHQSDSNRHDGDSNRLDGEKRLVENDCLKNQQEVNCQRQKNELKHEDSDAVSQQKSSENEQSSPNLREDSIEKNRMCSENSDFQKTTSLDHTKSCKERKLAHETPSQEVNDPSCRLGEVSDSESRLSSDSNSESKRKYATDSEASEEASSHDVASGSNRRHRGNTRNKKFKPVTNDVDIHEDLRVRVRDNMLMFADEDFPVEASESEERLNERNDSENQLSERSEPDSELSEESESTQPSESNTFRFRSARFGLMSQFFESASQLRERHEFENRPRDNAERMRQRIGFLSNLMESAHPNVGPNRNATQRSGERNDSDNRLSEGSESMNRLTERNRSVIRRLGRRRFISSDSEVNSEEEGAGFTEETEEGPSYRSLMREAIQKLPLPYSVMTYLNYDREF